MNRIVQKVKYVARMRAAICGIIANENPRMRLVASGLRLLKGSEKIFDECVDLLHQFDDCLDLFGHVGPIIPIRLVETRHGLIEEIEIVFDIHNHLDGTRPKYAEILPRLLKLWRPSAPNALYENIVRSPEHSSRLKPTAGGGNVGSEYHCSIPNPNKDILASSALLAFVQGALKIDLAAR